LESRSTSAWTSEQEGFSSLVDCRPTTIGRNCLRSWPAGPWAFPPGPSPRRAHSASAWAPPLRGHSLRSAPQPLPRQPSRPGTRHHANQIPAHYATASSHEKPVPNRRLAPTLASRGSRVEFLYLVWRLGKWPSARLMGTRFMRHCRSGLAARGYIRSRKVTSSCARLAPLAAPPDTEFLVKSSKRVSS
jgi:hypothetical protein